MWTIGILKSFNNRLNQYWPAIDRYIYFLFIFFCIYCCWYFFWLINVSYSCISFFNLMLNLMRQLQGLASWKILQFCMNQTHTIYALVKPRLWMIAEGKITRSAHIMHIILCATNPENKLFWDQRLRRLHANQVSSIVLHTNYFSYFQLWYFFLSDEQCHNLQNIITKQKHGKVAL